MDDGMVAVQGKDAADAASRRVRNDLSKAGLVENTEVGCQRSAWAWLGFIIDLEKGKMEVTVELSFYKYNKLCCREFYQLGPLQALQVRLFNVNCIRPSDQTYDQEPLCTD